MKRGLSGYGLKFREFLAVWHRLLAIVSLLMGALLVSAESKQESLCQVVMEHR